MKHKLHKLFIYNIVNEFVIFEFLNRDKFVNKNVILAYEWDNLPIKDLHFKTMGYQTNRKNIWERFQNI